MIHRQPLTNEEREIKMDLRQCSKCGFVITEEAFQALRYKTTQCSLYCHEEIGDYEKITGLQAAIMKARGLNQPPTKPVRFSSEAIENHRGGKTE